jgi:hypothetical protein
MIYNKHESVITLFYCMIWAMCCLLFCWNASFVMHCLIKLSPLCVADGDSLPQHRVWRLLIAQLLHLGKTFLRRCKLTILVICFHQCLFVGRSCFHYEIKWDLTVELRILIIRFHQCLFVRPSCLLYDYTCNGILHFNWEIVF